MDFYDKSSARIDDIPIILVKKYYLFISKPLAHIVNYSSITSFFKYTLKMAKMKPF